MHFTRRTFLASAAALAARPTLAAGTQVLGGPAFGSYWRLTLPEGADASAAVAEIERLIERIDRLMSPWRADSEISRINLPTSDLIPADPETIAVAREAMEIAAETGGAFDPTVGPLVARYGFGPIRDARPGRYTQIGIRLEGIRKDDPELSLDFCGIAKGYALDLMRGALLEHGSGSYVLELGGEVAAEGRHPTGRPWRAAIDGAPLALDLMGDTVATSGVLAQGYRIGGSVYGHIIDPKTSAPATGALLSVSVLGPSATRADGLATALFAMGLDAGMAHASAQGIDSVFLARDGEGVISFTTGDADTRLVG